jgi:two-component system, chemotaxis family, sensor kinase CheA
MKIKAKENNMGLDPELLKKLLDTFRNELDENIQAITDALLTLEKKPETKARDELIQTVFRSAHNIKGAARSVELTDIADISHGLEDLFSALQQKGLEASSEIIDLSLDTLDKMHEAMQCNNESKTLSFDKKSLLDKLAQAIDTSGGDDSEKKKPKNENIKSTKDTLTTKEKGGIKNKAEKKTAEEASAAPKPSDSDTQTTTVAEDKPEEKPEKQSSSQASLAADFVKVNIEKITQVTALSDELQSAKIELNYYFKEMQKMREQTEEMHQLWYKLHSLSHQKKSGYSEESISIISLGLDMNAELSKFSSKMTQYLHNTDIHLGFISTALQDDVRNMRLVPAATVLQPMKRTIRDIAKELEKKVEVDITGDEVEVDRAILDLARPPLIHLIRNAIDHGIEGAETRKTKNKDAIGKINIKLESSAGEIAIKVSDDGAGIDENKVAEIAVNKHIITPEERKNLSKSQILDFIFMPSFSTKDIITDISGRGVGLDVVRTNMQSAKGNVVLDTEIGKGSTFTLTLPLTLLTDRGMLFGIKKKVFAIPTNAVKRVLEVAIKDIQAIEGGQAILLDKTPIPLRSLAETLDIDHQTHETGSISVIIVSRGHTEVAFQVDEVLGEREIVVKPLNYPLQSVKNVSGAALSGRGDIVIVLNPSDLIESALNNHHTIDFNSSSEKQKSQGLNASNKNVCILVADDSITTRTLETNVLQSNDYQVTSVVNGKKAFDLLKQQKFDLVITDVEMPVMNGFELTEAIKSDKALKKIPVIIVTSKASDEDKKRGVAAGANAYIVKSEFETKTLLDTVEQLL